MTAAFLLPIVLVSIALGAHFLRWGEPGLTILCLAVPFLLIVRKQWTVQVVGLFLLAGTFVWAQTGVSLVMRRIAAGEPWFRAALIMGTVATLTAASALILRTQFMRQRHKEAPETSRASAAAFVLVFVLCAFPQARMHDPTPLLAERFLAGAGWLEIFVLSTYAAWLVEKLLAAPSIGRIRTRVWLIFSIVFFAQMIGGLAGIERLLMTGRLHLPVPALIVAGPIYRGEGFFMPVLFAATILIAGPVWCSWLCYIGSWDLFAARSGPKPRDVKSRTTVRIGILAAVIGAAIALRTAGAPPLTAAILGAAFGLGGVAVMLAVSRRAGVMVHCTVYCPIGLIADIAGRLNPFRIRLGADCTECRSCAAVCRYGALTVEDIKRRKPGLTCTLCGDCTSVCSTRQIDFHFPGLSTLAARRGFMVLVAALHAVFLGLGRL